MKAQILWRGIPSHPRLGLWLMAFLFLFSGTGLAQWSEQDLVTKIAEKEEQIRKINFEQRAGENFLREYEQNAQTLQQAVDDLERLRATLATIQRNNLIKSMILLAKETWEECLKAADLARTGVEKILANGYVTGILCTAYEHYKDEAKDGAQGIITDPVKEALGLDEESLSKPLVMKVRGVNDKAIAVLPELKKVNQALNLSIEGAKAWAYNRDKKDLGNVGALLYKNESIRDEIIPGALAKIAELRAEMDVSAPGMQERLEWLQQERESLQSMLNNYRQQLAELRAEKQAEAGATARQEMLEALPEQPPITVGTPPPDNPPYPVRGENESDDSYNSRLNSYYAAVQAIATHRELVVQMIKSQSLLIYQEKERLEGEIGTILAERDARSQQIGDAFSLALNAVTEYRGQRNLDIAGSLSLGDLVWKDDYLHKAEDAMNLVSSAYPEFVAWDEQLKTKCAELAHLTDWQDALLALAASTARPVGPYSYPVMSYGSRIEIAEDLWVYFGFADSCEGSAASIVEASAALLETFQPVLEGTNEATARIGVLRAKIAQAFPALVDLAEEALAEANENLANADYAMGYGIAAAADYARAVQDFEAVAGVTSPFAWRKGYRDQDDYVTWTVVPVIRRVLSFNNYRSSLAAAVAAGDRAKAQAIIAAYRTLCTIHATQQDRLHAANNQYFACMARLSNPSPYQHSPNWSVFEDWRAAHEFAQSNNSPLSVPTPPNIEQMTRTFYRLRGYQEGGWLDYSNPVIEGWFTGLANAGLIPDPGVENTPISGENLEGDNDYARTAYYEILQRQAQWDATSWGSLSDEERETAFALEYADLYELKNRMEAEDAAYAQDAFLQASARLLAIKQSYEPTPELTQDLQDQTVSHGTVPTLSVAISTSGGTYRWYYRSYYGGPGDYANFNLLGETSTGTYTPFALSNTTYFYVEIQAWGKTLRSRIATITVDPATIPPSIWLDLTPQQVPAGMRTSLAVYFFPPDCTVQWFKDGNLISTGTSNRLDLGAFDASKAGNYQVKVINAQNVAAQGAVAAITLADPGEKLDFHGWAQCTGREPWLVYDPTMDGLGLGVPNLLCYALGVEDASEAAKLHPPAELTNNGHLLMRFKKPKYVTGVNYTVERSTNLTDWSSQGVEMVKEGEDSQDENWAARSTTPPGAREFLRLRVEQATP